jgi:Fur family ferric uptake transcriptional regulator
MTRQRRALLAAIEEAGGHPTADEIYRIAKRRLPRISLGTIYRNLGILAEHGLVQSIEAAGRQRRFDADAARHYHVRCMGCGRLDDVRMKSICHVERAARAATGYEITGHRMELLGLCRGCATERDRKRKGAQRSPAKQGGA